MGKTFDLRSITERQILHIRNTLNTYRFIMREWNKNGASADFKTEFTNFYMSSQAIMKESEYQNPFFGQIGTIPSKMELPEFVEELSKSMPNHKYQFSFCTKLFHTINPNLPIYDSKVCKYLKQHSELSFWFNFKNGKTKLDTIKHDWKLLNEWYAKFQTTEECKEWICWFDKTFPEFVDISAVKKIDAIIYECGENSSKL